MEGTVRRGLRFIVLIREDLKLTISNVITVHLGTVALSPQLFQDRS